MSHNHVTIATRATTTASLSQLKHIVAALSKSGTGPWPARHCSNALLNRSPRKLSSPADSIVQLQQPAIPTGSTKQPHEPTSPIDFIVLLPNYPLRPPTTAIHQLHRRASPAHFIVQRHRSTSSSNFTIELHRPTSPLNSIVHLYH